MKVKCRTIYNENTEQYQNKSLWLTIGKEYVVLEIEIYPGNHVLYRLIGDNSDQGPGLYDSRQFDIVSRKLSTAWSIHQLGDEVITIGPVSWQALGFWEDCYDGISHALEIYKHEARIIMEEEDF